MLNIQKHEYFTANFLWYFKKSFCRIAYDVTWRRLEFKILLVDYLKGRTRSVAILCNIIYKTSQSSCGFLFHQFIRLHLYECNLKLLSMHQITPDLAFSISYRVISLLFGEGWFFKIGFFLCIIVYLYQNRVAHSSVNNWRLTTNVVVVNYD